MKPECFGVEFYDDEGSKCPHTSCLLYEECEKVYQMGVGVIADRRDRIEESRKYDKKLKKIVEGQRREFFDNLIDGGSQYPERKRGYKKPGKLLYKDEGTPRDKFLCEIRSVLQDAGYRVRATKCLHSFDMSGRFIIKVDTRRKQSLVIYIQEDVANLLSDIGMKCRSLFDSESPNFPSYLSWVVSIKSQSEVDKFIGVLEDCYEIGEDQYATQ